MQNLHQFPCCAECQEMELFYQEMSTAVIITRLAAAMPRISPYINDSHLLMCFFWLTNIFSCLLDDQFLGVIKVTSFHSNYINSRYWSFFLRNGDDSAASANAR